jgi:flagellar biosynthesis/type III secretory pathway M-ring protein FliF/YscJ
MEAPVLPEPTPLLAGETAEGLLMGPGGQPADHLQLARKIAREDPKIVANVVKSWVTKDE